MKKLLFLSFLMLSGLLIASNMGFKLTKTLVYADPNYANTNWISLPYYYNPPDTNSNGQLDAEDLCDDIGGTCNTVGNCTVEKFNVSTNTYSSWTCQTAKGTPFTLNPGEGINVKPNANVNFVIVGSHNPTLSLTLTYADPNYANTNWISIPYHMNPPDNNANGVKDAEDLCDDIGGTCNTVGNCTIEKFNVSTNSYSSWTCQTGKGSPFAISPGEAVNVKPNATITGYIPSHY